LGERPGGESGREQRERKVAEVWHEERAALRTMPVAFDGFAEKSCRISATCLVAFERNRYSVECRYVGQVVTLRAYAERIVVMCGGQIIGEHARCFERGRTLYNPWHYVAALERKPGALRNGAPFKDWNLPACMTRLRERLTRHADGDRQFVEILSMVAIYGIDAVNEACAVALEEQVASSAHVVNLLHRASEPTRAPVLQVPEALKLAIEPAANCDRYDQLLRARPASDLAIKVFIHHHLPEEIHANATDRTTQSPAPARYGERVGGEPDGLEPEEARPDQGQLLAAELADRQARSYEYQLRQARFPMPRDLDSFNFRESAVDEMRIRQLHTGEYLTTARNIVFVGGTGTGKTHLATALARQAVLQGKRARFYSVVDLVNQLDAEKREGHAGRLATRLLYHSAIVLDELGYLPFAQDGGAMLFHLISKLYERVSLIVTTA
jgi:DNA replication protein DnaC